MTVLLALLLASSPAQGGVVTLDRALFEWLQPPLVVPEVASGRAVESRSVVLTPQDDGVLVAATWQVRQWDDAPTVWPLFLANVMVRELVLDARSATARSDEVVSVTTSGAGEHTVSALVFVPGDSPVSLLAAAAGEVRVSTPERVLEGALEVEGVFLTGARELRLVPRPVPAAASETVVVATAALGLTVGDDGVQVQGRVRWSVLRGARPQILHVTITNAGPDLHVEGPGLSGWQRSGDELILRFTEPVADEATVTLRWTLPAADSVVVPTLRPHGVTRVRAALTVARDGAADLAPSVTGWTHVTASELPQWARGLVSGPLVGRWTGGARGSGSVRLLHFTPLPGPPAVVDVADWRVLVTQEGRSVVRGLLEVRNDRASHLRVRPPPGSHIVGVTVAGEVATPASDDGVTWLVPLLRSVETAEGALSFPVEVTLMGEAQPWSRRHDGVVALPVLDAPVAVSRATVTLPVGYRSGLDPGEGGVVDAFTEGQGISYGFGVGDVGAANADRVFQDAVASWLDNDYGAAQQALDDLRAQGAVSENIVRLQSNLDVVNGDKADVDETVVRRVKRQARARALTQERTATENRAAAASAELAGDYAEARALREEVAATSGVLALLDTDGDLRDQDVVDAALADPSVERFTAFVRVGDDAGRWDDDRTGQDMPWDVVPEVPAWNVGGEPWFLPGDDGVMGLGSLGTTGSGRGGGGFGYGSGSGSGSFGVTTYGAEGLTIGGALTRGELRRAPRVHASALSVTVPQTGQVVRYQSLLLPADAAATLRVDARLPHRLFSRRLP